MNDVKILFASAMYSALELISNIEMNDIRMVINSGSAIIIAILFYKARKLLNSIEIKAKAEITMDTSKDEDKDDKEE